MTDPCNFLDPYAGEPVITDPAELREHRKRRLALAYRVFGAMGWGSLGDGHISARDPEQPDCFWLGRYGVPFRFMTTDDLVLVRPDGTVEGGHINVAAYYIHGPLHEPVPMSLRPRTAIPLMAHRFPHWSPS